MEAILKHYKKTLAGWDGLDRSVRSVGYFVDLPETAPKLFRGCQAEILLSKPTERLVVERMMAPRMVVPVHRHPNVSSLDFGIWGSGRFWIGNHRFTYDEAKRSPLPIYVPRGAPHYGEVLGDEGAVIISFQFWYEWPAKESILLDWEAC